MDKGRARAVEIEQEQWRIAVASVVRKNTRAKHRTGNVFYERRSGVTALSATDAQRLELLTKAVLAWGGISSRYIVEHGVKANTDRMMGHQVCLLREECPEFLVTKLPADPGRPLADHSSEPWLFMVR